MFFGLCHFKEYFFRRNKSLRNRKCYICLGRIFLTCKS